MIDVDIPEPEETPGGSRPVVTPPADPVILVQSLLDLENKDLHDLCAATAAAIRTGGGFGWLEPPPSQTLENYWKGVLLVPERELLVGRMDGTIVGAVQLLRPPRNNEAQAFAASLVACFVAPRARGFGLAKALVAAVEQRAFEIGFQLVNLDLRETQKAAIRMFEEVGFRRWGEHPFYAKAGGRFIRGFHYYKFIDSSMEQGLSDQPSRRTKPSKFNKENRGGDGR